MLARLDGTAGEARVQFHLNGYRTGDPEIAAPAECLDAAEGLPAEVDEQIHPWDDYMQIAGTQSEAARNDEVEDDLFAGVRSVAVQS